MPGRSRKFRRYPYAWRIRCARWVDSAAEWLRARS